MLERGKLFKIDYCMGYVEHSMVAYRNDIHTALSGLDLQHAVILAVIPVKPHG